MVQWIDRLTLDPRQALLRQGMSDATPGREVLFDLLAADWDRQLAEAFRQTLRSRIGQSLRDLALDPKAWAQCVVRTSRTRRQLRSRRPVHARGGQGLGGFFVRRRPGRLCPPGRRASEPSAGSGGDAQLARAARRAGGRHLRRRRRKRAVGRPVAVDPDGWTGRRGPPRLGCADKRCPDSPHRSGVDRRLARLSRPAGPAP